MARSYSRDLRERFLRAVEGGLSARAAGRLYEIGASTAVVWVQRWRDGGEVSARPRGGFRGTPLDGEVAWLLELNRTEPDITLMEIQAKLAERGVKVGIGTIWRFFNRREISFKKNRARSRAGSTGRQGSAGDVESKPAFA